MPALHRNEPSTSFFDFVNNEAADYICTASYFEKQTLWVMKHELLSSDFLLV